MVQARYSGLAALVLSGMVATAHSQSPLPEDPSPPAYDPGPPPVPTYDPAAPPPSTYTPSLPPSLPLRSVVPALDPVVHHRFRSGQVVYGVGTAVGLIGSGLTLASIIVTAVYGLDQSAGQNTALIGPGLAYGGSGATGAGFILAATGLGMQHNALALIGQDPGRGMYATGTVFGILGLCGIGTSYFFGLTHYVDNSTAIAFGTSIAATALLTVGGLLFFSDATRLGSIYRRLTTF